MKKAIIYVRTSVNQTDEAKQVQIEALKKYCGNNGLQVSLTISNVGAGSVDELKRFVKNSDHFVVTGLDRISRDPDKCKTFCQFLEDNDIELHVVQTTDVNSTLKELLAKTDAEVRSKKIKAGLARKKAVVKTAETEANESQNKPKKIIADPYLIRELLIKKRDFKALAEFNRQEREKRA